MMTRRSLRRAGLPSPPPEPQPCSPLRRRWHTTASSRCTAWTPRRRPTGFPLTAEDGASFEGYAAECDAAVDAGYDALRAAGLPVGIKIFEKMTIGDPKHEGRMNPNGADGTGLEYFEAGSELPFQMVGTWIEGAESVDCSAV